MTWLLLLHWLLRLGRLSGLSRLLNRGLSRHRLLNSRLLRHRLHWLNDWLRLLRLLLHDWLRLLLRCRLLGYRLRGSHAGWKLLWLLLLWLLWLSSHAEALGRLLRLLRLLLHALLLKSEVGTAGAEPKR